MGFVVRRNAICQAVSLLHFDCLTQVTLMMHRDLLGDDLVRRVSTEALRPCGLCGI